MDSANWGALTIFVHVDVQVHAHARVQEARPLIESDKFRLNSRSEGVVRAYGATDSLMANGVSECFDNHKR